MQLTFTFVFNQEDFFLKIHKHDDIHAHTLSLAATYIKVCVYVFIIRFM